MYIVHLLCLMNKYCLNQPLYKTATLGYHTAGTPLSFIRLAPGQPVSGLNYSFFICWPIDFEAGSTTNFLKLMFHSTWIQTWDLPDIWSECSSGKQSPVLGLIDKSVHNIANSVKFNLAKIIKLTKIYITFSWLFKDFGYIPFQTTPQSVYVNCNQDKIIDKQC